MTAQAQFFGVFTGIPMVLGASCVLAVSARGPFAVGGGTALATQRLPTDSIGNCAVTFAGVNANSEIRVYLPDSTEVAGIELCSADQVLAWGVYASGNANNTVRVVIVHPSFKIKEFTYTASSGAQSLPVQQEPDKWYSNP